MITKLYSIQDIKTSVFLPPNHFLTEAAALRGYTQQFSKPGSLVNEFPDDYRVFYVGKFDDSAGKLIPGDTQTCICSVADLLRSKHEST